MALAPHSVANLGMSLWALGLPLATPVRYLSAFADHHGWEEVEIEHGHTNLTVNGTIISM